MNRYGGQFLARPRFPRDQHGHVGCADPTDHIEDLAHRGTGSDHFFQELILREIQALLPIEVCHPTHSPHDRLEGLNTKGFIDDIVGAKADGVACRLIPGQACTDNHLCVIVRFSQIPEQLDSYFVVAWRRRET